MSDAVLLALITSIPPTLVALAGFITVLRKVEQVHQATNSKMDAFIKVSGEAEHAKGVLQGALAGKAEEKVEQKARDTIAGISNRGT